MGGEPGRKVEPVGWEAPFGGGGPPGLGDVPLGRAKPCNSNNKRQVGSDTVNVLLTLERGGVHQPVGLLPFPGHPG